MARTRTQHSAPDADLINALFERYATSKGGHAHNADPRAEAMAHLLEQIRAALKSGREEALRAYLDAFIDQFCTRNCH